jgi:hypothetical protein
VYTDGDWEDIDIHEMCKVLYGCCSDLLTDERNPCINHALDLRRSKRRGDQRRGMRSIPEATKKVSKHRRLLTSTIQKHKQNSRNLYIKL